MKNRHYYLAAIIQSAVFIVASPVARAQDPATDGYVTRKEYEELKAQMLAMKTELDALKKEREAAQNQGSAENGALVQSHKEVAPPESAQGQAVADIDKQVATEAAPPIAEAE